MSAETAAAWVALAAAGRLDLPSLGRLHTRWPDPGDAVAALRTGRGVRGVVGPAAAASTAQTTTRFSAEEVLTWISSNGASLLECSDSSWPHLLDPPAEWPSALTLRGVLRDAPAVAIVGMRRCTRHGAAFAEALAEGLAHEGITVVSGLAFGIDAAAHRGSLAAGGHTVAVLAGGLGRISPRSHLGLAEAVIASGGALVSHLPPECDSPGWRFPIRNRLVAGLADVVVVVEAAAAGGALSTARHARDLGRPLLVVPGFPWDDHAAGTVALLADGAEVCRDAGDVLVALGLATAGDRRASRAAEPPAGDAGHDGSAAIDGAEGRILAAVEFVAASIEDVARRADVPLVAALSGLGKLELAGLVSFPSPATVVRTGRSR